MAKVDTDQIRREHPLSEYLPSRGIAIKADGAEWRACCPFHSEKTASFTIYPGKRGTQEFHCFGCGEKGDVVEFVQKWDACDFAEACEILGGKRVPNAERRPVSPSIETVDIYAAWVAKAPPADAPAFEPGKRTGPLINPKRPEKPPVRYTPTLVHPYQFADGRVLGYVLRVDIDGKKLTPTILWCENAETGEVGWCHRPMLEPRRPYRLPALTEKPDAQVLIVMGEKTADAAARLLPRMAVLTWVGGDKAVGKTGWTALRGRQVVIWPDNDRSGLDAAQELGRLATEAGATFVKVVGTHGDEKPGGWDLADAEAEGWLAADVLRYAKAAARQWRPETPDDPPTPVERSCTPQVKPVAGVRTTQQEKPSPAPRVKPRPAPEPEPDEPSNVVHLPSARMPDADDDSNRPWQSYLELDEQNQPKKKLMVNFIEYLRRNPRMNGVLMKNKFSGDVILSKRPAWDNSSGAWTERKLRDNDVTLALTWLERAGMTPKHNEVGTSIMAAAEARAFDPVKEYLTALVWDKVPRLQGGESVQPWMMAYLGVQATAHNIERAFGMRWMVAAVARNLTERHDGEKVDNMLIIEGAQGKMKSTALEVLATMNGRRYFTDSIGDIASKDAVMQMQGQVIVEIGELDAINKADPETVKRWVSRKVDSIRLPYGKLVVDLPRRAVLAGTVNPSGRGYLKDATGARRFWPTLITGDIDIAGLTRDRDQLWAEAVHLYRAGEPWWLQGAEIDHAAAVQRLRFQTDPWGAALDEWLDTSLSLVTVEAAFRMLGIQRHMQNAASEARIVNHLVANGYQRFRTRINARQATVYRKTGGDDGEEA